MFRHTLLAKQDSMMVIPYSKLTSNTSTNAAYIQGRLDKETGYPIDEMLKGDKHTLLSE